MTLLSKLQTLYQPPIFSVMSFCFFCTRILHIGSHLDSVAFSLESLIVPQSFLFFHDLDTFEEEYQLVFLENVPQFLIEGLCNLGKNCIFHNAWHLGLCDVHVLSLAILPTLNTLIRWHLLGFSTRSGMFPLVTNKSPGGDTLRLFKCPVSLYHIITNF